MVCYGENNGEERRYLRKRVGPREQTKQKEKERNYSIYPTFSLAALFLLPTILSAYPLYPSACTWISRHQIGRQGNITHSFE
jgi:hypothetical protein